MTWEIQKVEKIQYPSLVDIWEASVRATHDFIPEDYIQEIKSVIADEYFPIVDLFVIQSKNAGIIGFSGVANSKIEMLFIHPEYFRKGAGKVLVEHAIKVCGANQVDVNEQNPGAYYFYLSLGFEVISRSETDDMGKPFPILHLEYNPS